MDRLSVCQITKVWPDFSDHVALHVVLRRRVLTKLSNFDSLIASVVTELAPRDAGEQSACNVGDWLASTTAGQAIAPKVFATTSAHQDLQVVKVAGAATTFLQRLLERAEACLQHLDEVSWSPDSSVEVACDALAPWSDVPVVRGFKGARPGGEARKTPGQLA